MKYRTKEGEYLDKIVLDHYGSLYGYLEKVYDANRVIDYQGGKVNLSQFGLILPGGLEITLPERMQPTPRKQISLFD